MSSESEWWCVQDMRIAWEEPFGPVIPVIRVKNIDDAIDHCNSNNLALQVHTTSISLLRLVRVGCLIVWQLVQPC